MVHILSQKDSSYLAAFPYVLSSTLWRKNVVPGRKGGWPWLAFLTSLGYYQEEEEETSILCPEPPLCI